MPGTKGGDCGGCRLPVSLGILASILPPERGFEE